MSDEYRVNLDICVICQDSCVKKSKELCCSFDEPIEKIRCTCNGYCHRSCILEHIKINKSQKCILCNSKNYNPKYDINDVSPSLIKLKKIRKIINFFIYILNGFILLILTIILLIIMGYIFQLLRLLNNESIDPIISSNFIIGSILISFIVNIVNIFCIFTERNNLSDLLSKIYYSVSISYK